VHLVGATVIESEDDRPMTARSALELLGLAYALHPGFGEAEIIEMSAGVRPAFPDNVPRIRVEGATVRVNGAYRHGFLLAPVMAKTVVDWLATGKIPPDLMEPDLMEVAV
jgi:glycine oxidase